MFKKQTSTAEEVIADELKFRLLMVELSSDDPIVEAYMIRKLYDTYGNYSLAIPERVLKFIKRESDRITLYLQKQVEKKQKKIDYMNSKREEHMKKLEEEALKKKMEEEQNKLTRNQQIWGA